MINRIRDIRVQQGLTLADVAARCEPATTAQTIGRLETGMRNLSLAWMNRIAAALAVEPELLLKSEAAQPPRIVATLDNDGAEALTNPLDAVPPTQIGAGDAWLVVTVSGPCGEYRAGDQIWLRRHSPEHAGRLMNRDVLVPRPGGRFGFGRLIDADGQRVALLPPAAGRRQVVIDHPAWIASADLLVRNL
ncbi:helix-turn-helix domain-containing protein [Novosphingobium colocasiae]|uniref:helix-turn-helix domain-containing protein n=1 Tax=Novosphingobium colocasiae TaxID=1256513 RepID=UPI0035AE97A3